MPSRATSSARGGRSSAAITGVPEPSAANKSIPAEYTMCRSRGGSDMDYRRAARNIVGVAGAVLLAGSALAQTTNPRIGKWKLKQDAPPPAVNIMTYEAISGGGMKVTVDSVNGQGRESHWTYVTMFDGKDMPV